MMLRRIPALGRRTGFLLAQAQEAAPGIAFAVVVTDVKGDPFSGAQVTMRRVGQVADLALTDAHGVAHFTASPSSGDFQIRVVAGDLVAERTFPAEAAARGETLFIQLPVDRPEPILTPIEMGTLLLGGLSTGAGYYLKIEALQTAGEILLGAGVFTAIYRHGC